MDLYEGEILRQEEGKPNVQFITFKTYSFDMGDFSRKAGVSGNAKVQERRLGELLHPDKNGAFYKTNEAGIRSEIHQRLSTPLYSFVFAFLAIIYLGRPRTTREGRAGLLFTAFTLGAILRDSGNSGREYCWQESMGACAYLRRPSGSVFSFVSFCFFSIFRLLPLQSLAST